MMDSPEREDHDEPETLGEVADRVDPETTGPQTVGHEGDRVVEQDGDEPEAELPVSSEDRPRRP